MRLFDLYRDEDLTGVSGVGTVAQGVEFDDRTCALRWKTECRSTALYANIEDLERVHCHHGKTRIIFRGMLNTYDRARGDCAQDAYENAPFGSVGGLARRGSMTAPDYITAGQRDEYLRGYRDAARDMYGDDWETCSFGWAPAITIPARGDE